MLYKKKENYLELYLKVVKVYSIIFWLKVKIYSISSNLITQKKVLTILLVLKLTLIMIAQD